MYFLNNIHSFKFVTTNNIKKIIINLIFRKQFFNSFSSFEKAIIALYLYQYCTDRLQWDGNVNFVSVYRPVYVKITIIKLIFGKTSFSFFSPSSEILARRYALSNLAF